jgi:hypothetical protein
VVACFFAAAAFWDGINQFCSFSKISLPCAFQIDELLPSKMGALTPINQNAIKQGKCGNMERGQTERGK